MSKSKAKKKAQLGEIHRSNSRPRSSGSGWVHFLLLCVVWTRFAPCNFPFVDAYFKGRRLWGDKVLCWPQKLDCWKHAILLRYSQMETYEEERGCSKWSTATLSALTLKSDSYKDPVEQLLMQFAEKLIKMMFSCWENICKTIPISWSMFLKFIKDQ